MRILVDFLSQSIQFLYNITKAIGIPNYGLAIILFTIAVKVILYPLTYRQLRSMRRLQELQPKIQELQKKYKSNPQKAQQAMMELYQKEKVNPLGGCLPLLIQMPILYALFTSLRSFFNPALNPTVNLAHANFLWISNLGQPDPYILPVLVAVGTFFQQKVSMVSGGQDQTQKTMLFVMPLIIGWMSRNFSAGLSLYWVTFSLMGILEQWLARRQPHLVKEEISAK
ncbi:membrane protein [Moorella thermoacetica]|uniref:Membrane protein insertase YidC n=2 Tax=Neomoorella thermoacetica TaxID=1525 RepID=A0A1D7XF09_NEOTH|nr:YidC/Oxa1 family membrane protein insertase [Moorella thermoacetica]AKX95382.1 membrane protein insertase YidC [Moorella thermoacetica]AKX98006.1 membrane protein insertase YidC [Moorella thermoacetica]AOQ25494.1 Membrane protein insertase YidC [Moorella thermoacetica]OIQ10185.1 membrane protein insertase YidC [Moorella thermoacetica]OIQ56837.1 membrane protein insertase YidC [Moorella thermoacetica]